jgi:hypothetical protein
MGGPAFATYSSDLPSEMGAFATSLFAFPTGVTMFPGEAPIYNNYEAKSNRVDQAISDAVYLDEGDDAYAGFRATPYKGSVAAGSGASTTPLTGSLVTMNNNGQWTNGLNDTVGDSTLFTSELAVGDTIVLTGGDDEGRVFTVETITDDTHMQCRHYGFFYGFGSGNFSYPEPAGVNTFALVTGAVGAVAAPALPIMFNPQAYMLATGDAHSELLKPLVDGANVLMADIDMQVMNAPFTTSDFSAILTEQQLGLVTFASGAVAATTLQSGVAAMQAALPFAIAELDQISTVNVAAAIDSYVQPLVDELTAERDAEVLRMQKTYTIANGFFNSNTNDRVTEINNKYAKQIAKLQADAGLSVLKVLSDRATTALTLLARWENTPLRDRVLATELRLKAAEVGRKLVDSSNNLVSSHWAALYNYSKDSVARDYANDTTLWAAREENMRFIAEMNQAYLGTVNAGIGKGWGIGETVKAAMGAVQIVGGIASMIGTGGATTPLVAGSMASGVTDIIKPTMRN